MVDGSDSFDDSQMHRYLDEIGSYLAELRYIDQVFAYLDDAASTWWETAVDGVLSAGTSAGHSITLEFGGPAPFGRTWRVPLTVRLPWQDSAEEEVMRTINKIKADAPTWASSNMDSIRAMIKPLAHPTSAAYLNDLIQPVQDAKAYLEDNVTHDFGKLRHSLGNWAGDAADDFAASFYHPFEHTLSSHHRMLTALVTGLANARTVVVLTQQSLMNVLRSTRDALLEQLRSRAQRTLAEREASIKNALIIVSAVIPLLKGQELWDTRLDLAGVGISIATNAASPQAMDNHALTGGTAEELLLALSSAIRLVENNADHQYRNISEEVRSVLSRMDLIRHTPNGGDGRLVPPRPRLIDGTDGGNFYLPKAR